MQDDRKLDQVLRKAFQKNDSIFAWKIENSQIKKAALTPYKLTERHMAFKLNEESKLLIEDLWDSKRELKLYFESAGLFVVTQVIEHDGLYIRLSLPKMHDFEERRDQSRHFIDDFKVKIINPDGKSVIKNATDLSVGGFSIVLMKSEQNPFKNDDEILVELVSEGKKAKACVVKEDKIKPFEYSATPYGGRRLAFSFVEKDNEISHILKKIFQKLSQTGI